MIQHADWCPPKARARANVQAGGYCTTCTGTAPQAADADNWPALIVENGAIRIVGMALLQDGRYELVRRPTAHEESA